MGLERLNFSIPDFVRIAWATDAAREHWESKINAISRAWKYIERASLTYEMRNGILQSFSPEELAEVQVWAMTNRVPMVILALEGSPLSIFGNATNLYERGKPFTYRAYFGTNPSKFLTHWKDGNNFEIGRALGFPECCIKFFDLHWRVEGWRDLNLFMGHPEEKNLMYNNIFLKQLGVRPVFHLPCSINCKESCHVGMKIFDLWKAIGFEREEVWARELLSMPMRWSSLHGIAILTTPILRMVYNSDPIPRKVSIDLKSDYYPRYGASGSHFPFINVKPLHLHNTINGFRSEAGMQDAHKFLLQIIPKHLSGRVLDLGCGTGHLLQTIKSVNPEIELYGVEINHEVFKRRIGGPIYWEGDIFSEAPVWEFYYDLTMIAIQRLFEVPREQAASLLQKIHSHSSKLLIYSYDGWFNGLDSFL